MYYPSALIHRPHASALAIGASKKLPSATCVGLDSVDKLVLTARGPYAIRDVDRRDDSGYIERSIDRSVGF
jgi:hypothetical protein